NLRGELMQILRFRSLVATRLAIGKTITVGSIDTTSAQTVTISPSARAIARSIVVNGTANKTGGIGAAGATGSNGALPGVGNPGGAGSTGRMSFFNGTRC